MPIKRNDTIGAFFFVAFIISMSLIWLFEERFDKDRWRSEPLTRYKMVNGIINQDLLIGKTKDEVIVLLGKPNSSIFEEKDLFFYRLGKQPSFFEAKREQLLIVFKHQEVIEVAIVPEQ